MLACLMQRGTLPQVTTRGDVLHCIVQVCEYVTKQRFCFRVACPVMLLCWCVVPDVLVVLEQSIVMHNTAFISQRLYE